MGNTNIFDNESFFDFRFSICNGITNGPMTLPSIIFTCFSVPITH